MFSSWEPSPPSLRLLRLLPGFPSVPGRPRIPQDIQAHSQHTRARDNLTPLGRVQRHDARGFAQHQRGQHRPTADGSQRKSFPGAAAWLRCLLPLAQYVCLSDFILYDFLNLAYSLWPFCNIYTLPCLHCFIEFFFWPLRAVFYPFVPAPPAGPRLQDTRSRNARNDARLSKAFPQHPGGDHHLPPYLPRADFVPETIPNRPLPPQLVCSLLTTYAMIAVPSHVLG